MSNRKNSVPSQSLELPVNCGVFHRLTRDLTWVAQPNVEPIPVARINYAHDFSLVMGIYLALMKKLAATTSSSNVAGGSSSTISPLSTSSVNAIAVKVPTTRWLMLLGCVLAKCPSHYSAWKHRRDCIMQMPHIFASQCATEAFEEVLPVEVQEECEPPIVQCAQERTTWQDLTPDEREMVAFWTPPRTALSSSCGTAATTTISMWKCILWELRLISHCFVRDFHKNFQLWHHRKELLTWAIQQTPVEALMTELSFSQYLSDAHDSTLSFDDFDERDVCNSILVDEDSKNYHVWSHRMWFLTSFPFICRPYSATEISIALLQGSNSSSQCEDDFGVPPSSEALNVETMRRTLGSGQFLPSSGPHSFLTDELNFTAARIGEDWFNNSAWCHRFTVLKRFVMEPITNDVMQQRHNISMFDQFVRRVCDAEVLFALQWAAFEPCNECPFVFAKGVADMCQQWATMLHSLQHDDGAAAVTVSSAMLSWEEYNRTFELYEKMNSYTVSHIIPVVTVIREETRKEQEAHHASSSTNDDVEDEARSAKSKSGFGTATRSRFLRNNTHQPTAALFRLYFDRLESLWMKHLTEPMRKHITTEVPPASLAEILTTQETHGEDEEVATTDVPSWMVDFRGYELLAVKAAKELYVSDPIRAKYWKHMMHVVVFRQY